MCGLVLDSNTTNFIGLHCLLKVYGCWKSRPFLSIGEFGGFGYSYRGLILFMKTLTVYVTYLAIYTDITTKTPLIAFELVELKHSS